MKPDAHSGHAATALIVGHVTHDRYASGNRAGGSAFYASRAMRALGVRARLATTVGVDFERHRELDGLEMLMTVAGRTTTFDNEYRSGRARMQRVSGVAASVRPVALPSDWRKNDILLLAPVLGELDAAHWLDTVEAPIVGIGLQGFLKGVGPVVDSGQRRVVPFPLQLDRELLERLTVVFLSDEDFVPAESPDLLAVLRRAVPIVVMTLGAGGSRVWSRGGEIEVGIFPSVAKDPTGAGDVFAAAFLVAMSEGAEVGDAAAFASAAASIVVEEPAGTALDRVGECRSRAAAVPVRIPV